MKDTDQTNVAPRRPLAGRLARGGAIALAALAALAAIFYAEENWRGKRAWEDCKKRLESQQEVLDWGAYVPPAAPDDRNFFKAPKMQDWFVGKGSNELTGLLSLNSFEALNRELGRSNPPVLVTEWMVRAGEGGATNLEGSTAVRLDTFKFDGVSLGEALQQLARAAGLKVEIDPQVNSTPAAAVKGVWSNVTAQAVLLTLLCTNNLRWVDDPTNRGAGIIKAAESTPQAGVPDPANIVLAYLQNDIGPSVEAAEGFPLAADYFQQSGPIRLWVAPDSIPAKGQMARLFVGGGSLRVEPAGNSVRVMLEQAPIAAADYLKWSDQFSPQIDLIRQAVKRPVSRLEGDYQQFGRMPGINFAAVQKAARMLADRARCFLILGQPEQALDSLTLLNELSNCLGARPGGKPVTLASASGIMALSGLHAETISAGLRLHAWGEPELRALQDQLSRMDLVPLAWNAMESDRAWECHFFEAAPRAQVAQTLELGGAATNLLEKLGNHKYLVMKLMPAGWVYQNMARMATLRQGAIDSVDRALGVVRPHQVEEARQRALTVFRQSSPFSMLAKLATPPMTDTLTAAARAQALVNETLGVCALERYRLGRGLYPDRLNVLVPQVIPVLPVDPINGGALGYRHIGQGRFILYSVGWDEKDDGGAPMGADGKGDWVWGG